MILLILCFWMALIPIAKIVTVVNMSELCYWKSADETLAVTA